MKVCKKTKQKTKPKKEYVLNTNLRLANNFQGRNY